MDQRDLLDSYLEKWQKDLIDLTRRNRLINLGARGNVLAVVEPSYERVLGRLIDPTFAGWRFHYPPPEPEELEEDPNLEGALRAEDPDLDDELKEDELQTGVQTGALLSKRLRNLAAKASSEFIDRGLRVLYLTVGILNWEDQSSEWLESPLVLVPIVLDRLSPRDPFRLIDADEDWVVNPALAAKLESDFEIRLPEFDGHDVSGFIRSVKSLIDGYPGWNVQERMAIATLSFQKETMYQDLRENEAAIKECLSVRALTGSSEARRELQFDALDPTSDVLDRNHPPEELHSILDADGTQRACIIAAKEGKSFVMDGPPGSGKSQTIANVIAELLGDGKSVLFVSEKAAALEVVQQRLEAAHLGEFVLELHSHKSTRKAVATALGDSIRTRLELPSGREADARTLKSRRTELSDYANAINERRFLSPTISNLHDAIGRIGQLSEYPSVSVDQSVVGELSPEQFALIVEWMEQIGRAWRPVSLGEDFLWRELAEGTKRTPQAQINAQLDEASRKLDRLVALGHGCADQLGLAEPYQVAQLEKFGLISRHLASKPSLNKNWFQSDVQQLIDLAGRLEHSAKLIEDCSAELKSSGLNPNALPDSEQSLIDALNHAGHRVKLESLISGVRQTSRDASESMRLATELEQSIVDLTGELGVNVDVATPGLAEQVLQLFDLSENEHRPAKDWLEIERLGRVKTALRAVQPLVEEWKATEAKLKKHFNDNISNVDVEAFYDAETDVQPKLGRLSGRGRGNRKQLLACTIGGKITSDTLSLLPLARSWRALSNRLEQLDEAELLGPYFAGSATDLDAVSEALLVADSVLELSGQNADFEKIGRIVGFEQTVDPAVKHLRVDLEQKLTAYRARLYISQSSSDAEKFRSLAQEIVDCKADKERFDAVLAAAQPFVPSDDASIDAAKQNAALNSRLIAATAAFNSEDDRDRLSPYFSELDTDWEKLFEALEWGSKILDLEPQIADPMTTDAIVEASQFLDFEEAWADFNSAIEGVLGLFLPVQQGFLKELMTGSVSECSDLIRMLRNTSADINEWIEYEGARREIELLRLSSVLELATEQNLSGDQVSLLAEKVVLDSWVDLAMRSDPRLSKGRRQDRDSVLEQFRELDRSLAKTATRRVIERCVERRPTSVSGEFALIDHEAKKRRKHMSVRELLTRAGQASVDLKPCFMMSPLSVSQFLPPEIRFDCVIFDEASQVKPADAVNAVYRGRQLIVAGDERQLPPTSFFDRSVSDDDEYDDSVPDDFESVLNLAKVGLQQLPLRWHYRSLHESLISFSNREYYNSELISYPGAIQESDDLGVHFEYVEDGVYSRGGNKDNIVEARRVVDRIIEHAMRRPHLSVGVVAFSDAQANRITWELEAVRRDHPELDAYFSEDRLNGFFIKNLESVQGDERDIIIFSIGYGRDEFGKLTMNFGPVGQTGGQRRLNVAVTRAKRRVEVISSIRAADFSESSNPQVLSFRRYLDYAERGIAAFADDRSRSEETDSPFEQDVVDVIRSLGYEPHPQVGQAGYRIDIGVVHPDQPGRYVLGVECDGATYHSSRVARDRDRLRQEVLEGLGWTIHRVWSTSWFRDRQGEIEKLEQEIKSAIETPSPTGKNQRKSEKMVAPTVFEIDPIDAEWAETYSPDLGDISPSSDFVDQWSRTEAREIIKRIVAALAPVHHELIEAGIRAVYGFSAMGQSRKAVLESDLRVLVRDELLIKDRHGFYWMANNQIVRVRGGDPANPETLRRPAHVSPDEVKLALFFLVKDARSVAEEELALQTARLFGWKRTGTDIRSLIFDALNGLKKAGDIILLESGLLTTSDSEFPDLS